MQIQRTYPVFVIASLLAACQAPAEDPAKPDETPVEATPNPSEPVSILRPEVQRPEEEPVALAPLKLIIGFPEGGEDLDATATAALTKALESEQMKSDAPIVLRGHSDAGGSDAANQRASLARAEAVRDWLVKNEIAEDRIEVIAFGEQNPVKPNALPNGSPNEAGRAANRRVEIEIVPEVETPADASTEVSD